MENIYPRTEKSLFVFEIECSNVPQWWQWLTIYTEKKKNVTKLDHFSLIAVKTDKDTPQAVLMFFRFPTVQANIMSNAQVVQHVGYPRRKLLASRPNIVY